MKRKNLLLSLILLFAVLMPKSIFAESEDYLNYKFKEALNEEKTVYLYVDKDFENFIIAGKGKMDQNLFFAEKIYKFANEIIQEIEDSQELTEEEKEKAIDEIYTKSDLQSANRIELEIKSGVQLPDDSTGFFGMTPGLQFKNIIFPRDFDTSNVTNMQLMFNGQKNLNPDVSNWDTSNVKNMSYMFFGAEKANPDVSKWDTSKVESMTSMFAGDINANPDVSNWDTSNIKGEGLAHMFYQAKKADPDMSKWLINDIGFMQNLFMGSNVSEVDMRNWNFAKGDKFYNTAGAFYETNNLQYIYLNANHPFSDTEYENVLAANFKMQKDNEPASQIIEGSHNEYTFGDTGVNTLYFVPQKTSINIVWKDNDNKNGFRPDKQKIELLANGKKIESPITRPLEENPVELKEGNNWHHDYSDLDIFFGGKKIDYTAKAEDIDDYITDYVFKKDGTVLYSSQIGKTEEQKDGFTIINTYMTIAEEKPFGEKPRVPKNFVRVVVDTTDKASSETKYQRAFWVTPNLEIELPVDEPIGKDSYEFENWKALDPSTQIWNKGEKIKGQFKEETIIEAQYKEGRRVEAEYKEGNHKTLSPWIETGNNNTETHIAYIFGYPDNTVRPEGNITKAEAVTMIVRLKGYPIIEGQDTYKDVSKDEWYAPYIEAAFRQGILEEKEGESFRPDEKITRGELAQLISHIDKKNDAKAPFTDIEGYKYKDAIDQNYGNERILGYPDNTFKPNAQITRAETAAMLNRLFERSVKEEGLKNVKIHEFKDLKDKRYWAYYEIIEASLTHTYVRMRPNAVEELWKTIIK